MAIYLSVWFMLALLYNNLFVLILMFIAISILNYQADRAKALSKMLFYALPVVVFIILLNSILNQNGEVLLWASRDLLPFNFSIYLEPLLFSLSMAIKLLLILSIFSLFNILISVDRLFDIFGPYSGSPVIIAAMSAQMVPELAQRAKSIGEIQALRGLKSSANKSITRRIANFGPLLINLLRSALRNSLQTAEAIQVRGYGSTKRTVYEEEQWMIKDSLFSLSAIGVFIMALGLRYLGTSINTTVGENYYPMLLVGILAIPILSPLLAKVKG